MVTDERQRRINIAGAKAVIAAIEAVMAQATQGQKRPAQPSDSQPKRAA